MKKNSRAPRSLIATIVLGAFALGYALFVFRPAQTTFGESRKQLLQQREHVIQTTGLLPAIDESTAARDRAIQFSQSWRESLPGSHQLPQVLGQINAVAERAGVKLTRFSPEALERMETIGQLPVSLQCRGEFAELFALVHGLEQLPGTVWIEQVRLGTVTSPGGDLECELRLLVFADSRDKSS